MLTSVYFHCEPGSPITAAADPGANLLAAGLLWLALRPHRHYAAHTRLFLLLAFAFNGCWGGGQMIYSAALNREDWAFALMGSLPMWFWRPALGILGGALYCFGVALLAIGLQSYSAANELEGQRRARLLLEIPYISAGLAACFAAAFYEPNPFAAVYEAVLETIAANVGVWVLARRLSLRVTTPEPVAGIPRKLGWVATTALAVIAFAAVIGRGWHPDGKPQRLMRSVDGQRSAHELNLQPPLPSHGLPRPPA